MKELDIETFSEIMDEMITKSHVHMTFEMREGTQEVELCDNLGLGPVGQFFVLMKGMAAAFKEFEEMIDKNKKEECVDAILEMLKEGIMEEQNGHKNNL